MEIPQTIIDDLVEKALDEDIGEGDITTQALIAPEQKALAQIEFKEAGVLAGLFLAEKVFGYLDKDSEFTPLARDGELIPAKGVVARIRGRASALLTGERTALNFLQRLCGIATLTHRLAQKLQGTGTVILDTRKTIPTFRLLEKYAVKTGGGKNHRLGLYDAILIKNNHLKFLPSITQALQTARRESRRPVQLEVEVENAAQLKEALEEKPDLILLDNMSPKQIKEAVALCRGRVKLEISGGITAENLEQYARLGADFISAGCLTHSPRALDIHLNLSPLP